jgi:4-hydroxybenzoate polyprenyltransferase
MVASAALIICTVYLTEVGRIDPILFSYLLLAVIAYGIVVIQNDLSDKNIDILNKRKDIPLTNKEITAKSLQIYMFVLIVIGTVLSFMLGPLASLWLASYAFLGWLYSGPINLKSYAYGALFILGISYGMMPWLLPLSSGIPLNEELISVVLASFVFTAGIISLKDYKDYKGDKKSHKNTLLVNKGAVFTKDFIVWITSSAYLILILYLLWNKKYLFMAIGLILIVLNWYRLRDNQIITTPAYRGVHGRSLRTIFFLYTCLLYTSFDLAESN